MIFTAKAPMGARTSDLYDVTVAAGDRKESLSVYTSLVSDGLGERRMTPEQMETYAAVRTSDVVEKAYYTGFTADEEVTVTVTYHGETGIVDVLRKEYTKRDDTVTFRIKPGEKTIIRVDNNTFANHLCLACDAPAPIPKDKKNLIEIPAGDYTADNCDLIHKDKYGFDVIDAIPDDTTFYLHRGAVMHAALILENKHDVHVCGEGTLDTTHMSYGDELGIFEQKSFIGPLRDYTPPTIYIKTDSHHITVENVTLNGHFRGVVTRNAEDIVVNNVKVYTSTVNADGINMMNTRRMKIENCLVRSHDDTIAIFTACDSILYLNDPECKDPVAVSKDIEVSHCTLLTPCRNFCIGGHSTGSLDPRNLLCDFYAHDIDAYNYRIYPTPDLKRVEKWSGALRVLSQTEQDVQNIVFENVDFTERYEYDGKPIHVEVRGSGNASYTEKGGYRIKGVTMKNIRFNKRPGNAVPAFLICDADSAEPDYGLFDVTLENVTFGGVPMKNSPEFVRIQGNVQNVIVK